MSQDAATTLLLMGAVLRKGDDQVWGAFGFIIIFTSIGVVAFVKTLLYSVEQSGEWIVKKIIDRKKNRDNVK